MNKILQLMFIIFLDPQPMPQVLVFPRWVSGAFILKSPERPCLHWRCGLGDLCRTTRESWEASGERPEFQRPPPGPPEQQQSPAAP